MNIANNRKYSLSRLYQKDIEINQYIELYEHPAAILFQCIYAW